MCMNSAMNGVPVSFLTVIFCTDLSVENFNFSSINKFARLTIYQYFLRGCKYLYLLEIFFLGKDHEGQQ
jgi:hypothetical protein